MGSEQWAVGGKQKAEGRKHNEESHANVYTLHPTPKTEDLSKLLTAHCSLALTGISRPALPQSQTLRAFDSD